MKIEANVWQKVPGTPSVEIFPIIPKANCVSSNCYIFSAPDALVVVDPGASREQTQPPAPAQHETVRGLANAIASLKAQGSEPFDAPYHFELAGWVANRWCEILPVPLAAKQKLMELPDPLARLALVDEFLRGKGVVK